MKAQYTQVSVKKISGLLTMLLLILTACKSPADSLEQNFAHPPPECKPRTWMHAMSGNMSEAGLSKDLESIKKAGIGGVLLFNVSQGIPNGPVVYNSEQHHQLIRHAARECERLGLSFGVHNCDGWSSSGGPWIKPEQSMKMVAWTETLVQGKDGVEVKLAQPTTREGFYRDIAVLAYPSLASEVDDLTKLPVVSSSDPEFDASVVADYKIDRESKISQITNENPWIQYTYKNPRTITSIHLVFNDRFGEAVLQSSRDGISFQDVEHRLYKVRTGKGEWGMVDHFDPVTARYFRLKLNQGMTIKEARLMSTYSIQNFLGRTSMARTEDAKLLPIGEPDASMIIPLDRMVDLSDRTDSLGILRAKLPPGPWTVLRFGYTSTGAFNHPASAEGRGLECDKFSREAFQIHYDAFTRKVIEACKKDAPKAMQYIEIDSYEMGGQNWTEGFRELFREKKGYELTAFLPLFAGKFVESGEASEAVLWDLREIHCQLMEENYYGYFTELCHRDGVLTYIEPYGNGPFDDLDAGGKADMVMGEFWMNRPMTQVASAISSGHIYGKEIISAESFTSTDEINWQGHPAMAKLSGDRAWAAGITEFMFHRFVHQANTHVEPGLTMNRWGFHFDRTQTWWKNAAPSWFKYMARGSYLLRQGVPVSDLLVFVGDASPSSTFDRDSFQPPIPAGTKFDCVNKEVLLNRIQIENKQLVLPEGTSYKALVLKNCKKLSLETLERIYEIGLAGVPVLGVRAFEPAGYLTEEKTFLNFERMLRDLAELSNCYPDYHWKRLYQELNLSPDFTIKGREDIDYMHRKVGKDDFYFFYNPDTVARTFELSFRVKDKIPELWDPMTGQITRLGHFTQDAGGCRAWVPLDAGSSVFVAFRESSRGIPVVAVDPDESLGGRYELSDHSNLILKATQNGVYTPLLSTGEELNLLVDDLPPPIQIQGPWKVEFLKQHNEEALHVFEELTDWKNHEEPEINYYSGTAVYQISFEYPHHTADADMTYFLDLGQVHIVAEATLNGNKLDVLWKAPFTVDITAALKAGENLLEIAITNQWTNRLIGDLRFPDQGRIIQLEGNFPKGRMPQWYVENEPLPEGPRTSFCSGNFYQEGDELLPSGLLGPVFITAQKTKTIP